MHKYKLNVVRALLNVLFRWMWMKQALYVPSLLSRFCNTIEFSFSISRSNYSIFTFYPFFYLFHFNLLFTLSSCFSALTDVDWVTAVSHDDILAIFDHKLDVPKDSSFLRLVAARLRCYFWSALSSTTRTFTWS